MARGEGELPILCQLRCLTNQDISFPKDGDHYAPKLNGKIGAFQLQPFLKEKCYKHAFVTPVREAEPVVSLPFSLCLFSREAAEMD